jgi:hypothetical protein
MRSSTIQTPFPWVCFAVRESPGMAPVGNILFLAVKFIPLPAKGSESLCFSQSFHCPSCRIYSGNQATILGSLLSIPDFGWSFLFLFTFFSISCGSVVVESLNENRWPSEVSSVYLFNQLNVSWSRRAVFYNKTPSAPTTAGELGGFYTWGQRWWSVFPPVFPIKI